MAPKFLLRAIALTSAISLAAAGDGADLLDCSGYVQGSDYQVNILYDNLQSQSVSSICGNFQKSLSFPNKGVTCNTSQKKDLGNVVQIGVLMTGTSRSPAFFDVQGTFTHTLQADIGQAPNLDGCTDVPLSQPATRRAVAGSARAAGREIVEGRDTIQKRNLVAGVEAEAGDTITIAGGATLQLIGLIPTGGDEPLDTNIVMAAVNALAGQAGNFGVAVANAAQPLTLPPGTPGLGDLVVSFDAGQNGGAGNINVNDWTTIIGSLVPYFTGLGRRGTKAVFKNTAGQVVLTVSVAMLLSSI